MGKFLVWGQCFLDSIWYDVTASRSNQISAQTTIIAVEGHWTKWFSHLLHAYIGGNKLIVLEDAYEIKHLRMGNSKAINAPSSPLRIAFYIF
jgi:hypothetical protein